MQQFQELTSGDMMDINGGGIVYDFFYAASKGAHELVNDTKAVVTQGIAAANNLNFYYSLFLT